VKWGDVLRFRRGSTDVPGNGAPSELGAIRTIGVSPFKNGRVEAVRGDTFYAVIEYSVPQRAEVCSTTATGRRRAPSTSTTSCHWPRARKMRPMWRTRAEIEANLESRKVF